MIENLKNLLLKIIYYISSIFHLGILYKINISSTVHDIKFSIGPFYFKSSLDQFYLWYCDLLNENLLNDVQIIKSRTSDIFGIMFTPQIIKKRIFNKSILDLHKSSFMLGQALKFINKDKLAIDVGANTGMYSSEFSKKCTSVYSFECVDPVFLQLLNTSAKFSNITPIKKAVGDSCIKTNFYIDDNRLSNSGLFKQVTGSKVAVDVVTIDSLNLHDIGFLKIDTEGTEFDVIIGATNTIKENLPVVMVECYPKFSKYDPSKLIDYFLDLHYQCYVNIKHIGLLQIHDGKTFVNVCNDPTLIKLTDCDFLFTHGNNTK